MKAMYGLGLSFYGFICGAAVMLIEFAASRLLAPYFGTSIIVWGNIIGVVMIALALGYYIGGRLADRSPMLRTISYYVLFASVVTAFSPLAVQLIAVPLGSAFQTGSSSLVISAVTSFFVVLLIFAVPLTVLGMVSPFLIRIATQDVQSAGKVAGNLYAWSTMGSIAGTFMGSFVLIPFLGSRETIWIASLALALVAVVGTGKKWVGIGLLLPPISYLYVMAIPLRLDAAVIEQGETAYQFYAVVDKGDRYGLQYNEGLGTQSYIMKTGPSTPTGEYYDYISAMPQLLQQPDQAHVLVLGMAAGTLTGQLRAAYPNQQITGVEIDPAITELAARRFQLDDQHINVVNDDGRNFLRHSEAAYEMIVMDVYSNELYIPWHMATQEYFTELKQHLTDDGFLVMNIASTSSNSAILQSILATLHTVFPYMEGLRVPQRGNYVIVASMHPIPESNFNFEPTIINNQALVFTDNRAPAELFTEAMVLEYIRSL